MRRSSGFITVIAGLLAGLAGAEGVLRLFDVFRPPPTPYTPPHSRLYHPDPELGYTLRPSSTTIYHYPIGSTRALELAANRDGFRSLREIDEPDPRLRIWVLGDSMVLGDGVAVEDRLTEVIETLEPEWRVDNLGMTGWGLDLMVRAYERMRGRLEPDVVLLALYTDDFRRLTPFYRGQGYEFPKFELEGGRLVSVPFPQLPRWRRLRVVHAVEQVYWHAARNRFDLNAALLERLHRTTAPGTRLAIAFLPGRSDVPEDRTRRAWLRQWCERAGVPFVDLTDAIHGAGPGLYLENNPHWNERGHQVAGEVLHRFLAGVVDAVPRRAKAAGDPVGAADQAAAP